MTESRPKVLVVSPLDDATLIGIGPNHPSLGAIADYGTYARLDTGDRSATVLAQAIVDRLADLAVETTRVDVSALDDAAVRLLVEGEVFARTTVVWALGGSTATFLVAGPDVPSYGERPPCSLETAVTTAGWLAGAVADPGGTLFSEPSAPEDRALDDRLRELYGE